MKAWTMMGLVAVAGLGLSGCKDAGTTTPDPTTSTQKRTKWLVTGTLDAPHYGLGTGSVHAHVKAKFTLQVNTEQPYDADTANGPVPAEGLLNLITFEVSDQHYHPPFPNCVPAAFTGTLTWQKKGGLYMVVQAGFQVDETRPAFRLPIGEGQCDTLSGETAASTQVQDILFWVPQEVQSGNKPPAGGFVNLGEESSAAESTATTSDTDWVLTWTEQ